MSEPRYYSTAEVSAALGVSVGTVKRWVDGGVLPAHKTAGGHRKIPRADLLRLVREGQFPHIDLTRLNLSALPGSGFDPQRLTKLLYEGLSKGDLAAVRAVIHGSYRAGTSLEDLADLVIGPAMQALGQQWEKGCLDVYQEHRGTILCTAALHELKPSLQAGAEPDRLLALGGNPEGDHYSLASALIEMVLLDAGWQATNLGPNTPLPSMARALHELRPRMIWLSVSHLAEPERFLAEYRTLYREAERANVAVAVGGMGLQECLRSQMPYTFHGDGLRHLAAFARTLHPRPRAPKRGRPRKES